jgi:hypothetical protein
MMFWPKLSSNAHAALQNQQSNNRQGRVVACPLQFQNLKGEKATVERLRLWRPTI